LVPASPGGFYTIWRQVMRKVIALLAVLLLLGTAAWAHMGSGMMGSAKEGSSEESRWGPGWGMGSGMMGMGYGHMMGSGMMGMGYGHMMGQGMMGMGMMYLNDPEMRKFLDETVELRRKLLLMKFDYFEAMRKPDVSAETVKKMRKELTGLMRKLQEKSPTGWGGCCQY
jgi:hypothetical protein